MACKAGGILVNLIFLPLYQRLLSPEEFGIVALLISLQALLTVMDFGTSTLVARDLSAATATGDIQGGWRTLRSSERLLSGLFGLAFGGACLAGAVLGARGGRPSLHVLGLVLPGIAFLLVIALINLVYTALNALQSYRTASSVQVAGVLGRAGFSVVMLKALHGGIGVFLLAQLAVAILHWAVSRLFLGREMAGLGFRPEPLPWRPELRKLVRRALPLMLLGASGALATQLDKTIVSMNISLREVGPYFLAFTYALTPASILGGPVAQYFLPKVIAVVATGETRGPQALRISRLFALVTSLFTLLPCALLYIYCDEWVSLWLHGSPSVGQVATLARVLLLGGATASLTYLPYVLLNAVQDYKFMAATSLYLTAPLLTAVWIFTRSRNLMAVVLVYVAYYLVCIGIYLGRTLYLDSLRAMAGAALRTMAGSTLVLLVAEAGIALAVKGAGVAPGLRNWAALGLTAAAALAMLVFFRKRIMRLVEVRT